MLKLLGDSWKRENGCISINSDDPIKFIETGFPPSLWSEFAVTAQNDVLIPCSKYGHFVRILEDPNEKYNDFPYDYHYVDDTITGLREVFGYFNVWLTSVGIIIEGKNELPLELIRIMESKDNNLLVPLIYLPLLHDYYTEIFPVYFPIRCEEKLAKLFSKLTNREWLWSNDVIYIETDNFESVISIIEGILRDLHIETSVVQNHENQSIEIQDASKHYTQLWHQKFNENPLYQSEHRFKLTTDTHLYNLIPVKEIRNIVCGYNFII